MNGKGKLKKAIEIITEWNSLDSDIDNDPGFKTIMKYAFSIDEEELNKLLIIRNHLKKLAKYKIAIEILKDKLEITINSHAEYFNQPMISGNEIYKNLTQEEYKLLKEVLEDESKRDY